MEYSDVVWRVQEEFIAQKPFAGKYGGELRNLRDRRIGVLRGSLQAEELQAAGMTTDLVPNQTVNMKLFIHGRSDLVLIPREVLLYNLDKYSPKYDKSRLLFLTPPYKTYEMYVAFSKKWPNYLRVKSDFNRGLQLIKNDGTYDRIVRENSFTGVEKK